MNKARTASLTAAAVTLFIPLDSTIARGGNDEASVITEWNQLLQDTVGATPPFLTTRSFSMLPIVGNAIESSSAMSR